MIVVPFFLLIMNQTNIHLVPNSKENWHDGHICLNLSDYEPEEYPSSSESKRKLSLSIQFPMLDPKYPDTYPQFEYV